MKRLATFLCILSMPAFAVDYATVNVDTSATNATSGLGDTRYRSVLIENGGGNDIYCSRNASVTTSNGHKVSANDGWRSFPYEGPIYCVAATAAQNGTGRNLTIVWGSYQ